MPFTKAHGASLSACKASVDGGVKLETGNWKLEVGKLVGAERRSRLERRGNWKRITNSRSLN